jgi:hypothetical protein
MARELEEARRAAAPAPEPERQPNYNCMDIDAATMSSLSNHAPGQQGARIPDGAAAPGDRQWPGGSQQQEQQQQEQQPADSNILSQQAQRPQQPQKPVTAEDKQMALQQMAMRMKKKR